MSTSFWIWWFIISNTIAIHISTIGTSSLPEFNTAMALGYDNTTNLIWLIGGFWNPTSLISFNLSLWNDTNAFVNHGPILSISVSSGSQPYVQKEAVVYVVQPGETKLLAYDMLTENMHSIDTIYVRLWNNGCLASIGDWIIYTFEDQTFILKLSTQSWKLSGNPVMKEERHSHACIVEPDGGYLYVIGGQVRQVWESGQLDSIQKLYVKDIANIEKYNFSTLTDTLTRSRVSTAAVLHKTDIYVAGGLFRDDMDVIDTRTDAVILWGKLQTDLHYGSSIVVGDRLYIFGGWASSGTIDYWQYFDLFSDSIYIHLFEIPDMFTNVIVYYTISDR